MRVPLTHRTPLFLCLAVLLTSLAGPAAPSDRLALRATEAGFHDRDVPQTVWFQGFLADAVTSEPVNATYEIIAEIHQQDAGGSPIWGPETHADTPIVEGWFNIELGAHVAPLPAFDDPPYYLELTVNGEVLSPRQKLASAPTALLASAAHEPDEDWTIDGSNIYRMAGNVGVGNPSPEAKLDVEGLVRATAFQLDSSPAAGHVLTSNAAGEGSWQPAAGNVSGSGGAGYVPRFTGTTTLGNSSIYESGGRIGIGTTTTSDATITVGSSADLPVLYLRNTAASAGGDTRMLKIERTEPIVSAGDHCISMNVPDTSTDGRFIGAYLDHAGGGGLTAFAVEEDGSVFSTGGGTFYCYDENRETTLRAYNDHADTEASAVYGNYTHMGSDAAAVLGEANASDYWGYGGKFRGGYVGAIGEVLPTGSNTYFGLRGNCAGGSGTNCGVRGDADGTGTNYGVYGVATSGATNWAGYFDGDVRVVGNLDSSLGGFKIDHPVDPENSTLRHAYVASSERANVYSGNVTLGGAGEAWVELPDWFEALNEDLRYQLTPIGGPAPDLHVADPVQSGRFRIAGGGAGTRVSWQVTGVRRDPVAEQSALVVEQGKRPEHRGRYLDPEAHGAPVTQGIGHQDAKPKDR